jgi:enoyl-CoA hydratase/carnithine racemase
LRPWRLQIGYIAAAMNDAPSRRGREAVLTVEKQAGIATLSFNRPEASNAINSELRRVLATALDDLAADRGLRVVVLTSTGDEPFSVGMDVAELAMMSPAVWAVPATVVTLLSACWSISENTGTQPVHWTLMRSEGAEATLGHA